MQPRDTCFQELLAHLHSKLYADSLHFFIVVFDSLKCKVNLGRDLHQPRSCYRGHASTAFDLLASALEIRVAFVRHSRSSLSGVAEFNMMCLMNGHWVLGL